LPSTRISLSDAAGKDHRIRAQSRRPDTLRRCVRLDANGKPTNAADAVNIEFSEYAADDRLISVTTAALGPCDDAG
jgi:hypothetical protein